MQTRTISVIAGTNVTIANNSTTPVLLSLEGYCNGVANTQYFLQLHNVIPTTGVTVPMRS